MPKANIVLAEGITVDNRIKGITEDIIQKCFIENADTSSRQIPSKIKYRQSLPLTANSKINFNALINEGEDDTEISVAVEETNLSVGKIQITVPNK